MNTEDKERIEKEAEQFSKTLTSDWHKNQDAKLCYIAGANAERERIKHEEILSEQNAFHLVKALDLIDECHHYLKATPPSKNSMTCSKWESLVEETDYMREFNADADHERHNKDTTLYSQEVIDSYEQQLKEERNKAIEEVLKILPNHQGSFGGANGYSYLKLAISKLRTL